MLIRATSFFNTKLAFDECKSVLSTCGAAVCKTSAAAILAPLYEVQHQTVATEMEQTMHVLERTSLFSNKDSSSYCALWNDDTV